MSAIGTENLNTKVEEEKDLAPSSTLVLLRSEKIENFKERNGGRLS
jgi:hypothetical protein